MLITFATSIPALALYQPVLDHPAGYVAGGGHDTRIYLAAFLELLLIISNIGTAVVPLPVFRRQSEILALGYVSARIMECVFIAVGILAVVGVVSLRQDSPDATALATSLAAPGVSLGTVVRGVSDVQGVQALARPRRVRGGRPA